MSDFKKLHVWQRAHALSLCVDRVSKEIRGGRYASLRNQIFRAAASIPANIAEGSAKRGPREFRRFLDIALGSLAELSYAILFAKELGYLSESDWKELDELRSVAGKLTWGFYRLIAATWRLASSFHHSIIPSFHHSIIPSFHHSIILTLPDARS